MLYTLDSKTLLGFFQTMPANNTLSECGSICIKFERVKDTVHFPANPAAPCRFADKMGLHLSLWH